MNDELTTLLARIPEPTPPSSITATVMARIAREADREQTLIPARVATTRGVLDHVVWVAVLAGLAVVLSGSAYGWIVEGTGPDMTSMRLGRGGPALMTLAGPSGVLLGLGLLVFVAGLFAPLRGRNDQRVS